MKPRNRNLIACLGGTALLSMSVAQASTLYWDGNNTSVNADGGVGTWINGGTTNWDTLPFGGTDSAWANGDTAVFGGLGATVTVGTGGVTAGGLRFNANNYVINAGTNGLNFSSGTNVIQAYIGNNASDTGATITGLVGGTGSNIDLRSGADQRTFTLNMNGTSAGGWTGTTTLNAGTRINLSVLNQGLLNTSGITLGGGNILLTNANNATEAALDRVSNSAAIASYGSGSILMANTAGAGRVYSETIGSITHNNGQLNLGFTTVQNGGGAPTNSQTLFLNGLTNSGTTSTVAIYSGGSGAGAIHGNSNVRVNGITAATTSGDIIGPWMTAGTGATQSDWAVYASSDGVSGRIGSANIAATAQGTWSSTTGNYTSANAIVTTSPVNNRLTADRFVNTLRATYTESNAASHTMDSATDTITFTGHALTNGDVVAFRSAGGLTDTRPYYVINSAANTFQLSLTPGGSLLDLTSDTEGFITTGLNLNGNTLGTNGFIVGTTGTATIGGGSASTLTLATATTGNLYLHGAAGYWVDPSIKDNGAGVLTLVKGGTSTLNLSGNNTYTGGTVINSGTVNFATAGSWVSGQNLTFGGAGSITASVGALSGGTLDVDQGAVGVISGSSAITFTSTTGSGKLVYAGGNTGAGVLNMGNASAFTGDLQVSTANGSNPYPVINFSSIGDTAGSSIQYGGGQGDSNQRAMIAFDGSSALTLANRQIQLLPRSTGNNGTRRSVLMNNSTNAAAKLVVQQDLLNTVDRTNVEFQLDGSNTGNNEFSGDIGDSTYSAVASPSQFALNVYKNGAGKWILSGDNTFTGRLLISQGTLSVGTFNDSSTAGALGMGSVIQLGGAEASPITGGSVGLLSSSNSGTLEYTGGAASTSRTFQIGSLTSATGGGTIANNGSGALTFTAANLNDTIGGVTATRTLTLAGSNTGNNDVQGIIRDNVASTGKINLAKDGAGKWILSGANSYTGTTTVNGGSLLINGSTSSTSLFTVNTTATLGGTGSIGGAVTVNSGGTLAPGASIESLASGALTMNSGSTFSYEAADNSAVGADLLGVNGALTLTGVNLNFDLATVAALSGAAWTVGDKLTLISYLGADVTSGFTGYADDTAYSFGSNSWVFNYNDTVAGGNFAADAIAGGQNRFVTLTAVTIVPEPSSAALLGALGTLALLRRRR